MSKHSKESSDDSNESSKKSRNLFQNAIDLQFAVRPNFGVNGIRFKIKTNNLRILDFQQESLYVYKFVVISVSQPIKPPLAFKIFSSMGLQNIFANACPVFDGSSSIYSCQPLPIGNDGEEQVSVILPAEGKMRAKTFTVTICKSTQINLQTIKHYVSGQVPFTGEVQTCFAFLNTVLNYKSRNKFLVIKNGIFPEFGGPPKILASGIELKHGYCQSVRPGMGQLIVNVDVCAACLYPAGSLLEFVKNALMKRNVNELKRGISDTEKKQLERALRTVQIHVIHRGDKPKRLKIERLSSQAADDLIFDKDGQKVSVTQYYYNQYHRRLEFGSLPCVLVKRTSYIPIELCEILPGQRYEKSIDDKAKADMIKFTALKPRERFDSIDRAIRDHYKYNEDENLRDFGIVIEQKMIEVEGRLLDPPIITYDKRSQESEFPPKFGRWNLMNKIFPRIVPTFPSICNGNPQGNLRQLLAVAYEKARVDNNAKTNIILVIIPKKASQPYGAIKKIADTELGVVTQCIVADRLRRFKDKGLLSNISLKINAKLGGRNCCLGQNQLTFVTERPTIIMGADISHPGPGQTDQPSIAAVCASMEITGMVYCGRYSTNREIRNETIEQLEDMTCDLLKFFLDRTNMLPERVIFYRDGVSEGQFRAILNREIMALKKAFEKVYKNRFPTLTFVIAQKRHHTRFLPVDQRTFGDRNGNCQPGTCVDNEIVNQREFDFYLQSHAGIQGTVRPTRYFVLYDENKFSADDFQRLTYRLCYLYTRCTLSTSIVPPICYAHLLAARVRLYPRDQVVRDDDDGYNKENRKVTLHQNETASNSVNSFECPPVSPNLAKTMYFV
ncbi:14805_t:CDS:10 [Acaulospora morrowiae]|uniref:14805_t:CDS:1 n=1 Tax=Acaulospora morrowiae TaxID=94023 RepID=A0A9N8Z7W6_9GLOM|nr:14805_t:CDS:10 [Acaulospora morrowiae]